ncbi:hypothetical protein FCV66_11400 [Enterovibrio norvegicus]|uniref:hypothetical protein n=1 Tax=Enterovibrio norvegicus TaxID=188144 RepID=UPI001124F07A|nr:hypothetical protein [Enterovibrio norvegicus]MCC4798579.1 hypothetical protein [Enterovibrio norvegicus]TKF14227.1 hypothetical protein FCV66_11400 [Enterovibrio norvegicus]
MSNNSLFDIDVSHIKTIPDKVTDPNYHIFEFSVGASTHALPNIGLMFGSGTYNSDALETFGWGEFSRRSSGYLVENTVLRKIKTVKYIMDKIENWKIENKN